MSIFSNLFSPRQLNRQTYSYQNNLICDLRVSQLRNAIQGNLQLCSKCLIRKKNHYCIEPKCSKRQLICSQCDVNNIDRDHYMHDNTYILPLFTKDIFTNFFKLKSRIVSFNNDVDQEIKKINDYLCELKKVKTIAKRQINRLQQEEQQGKIQEYLANIEQYLSSSNAARKINQIFDNIRFTSAVECNQKQQVLKNQIQASLNNLIWPKDPQKVLKDKLKQPLEDERRQVFISRSKILQMNQIDLYFKSHYQFLTQGMQNHLVKIVLQPELLSKPKFYESFIYHFKDCKRLSLDNGNINHIRTPLTFHNLRELEFIFNLDAEPQTIKVQQFSDQLRSLTLKRFREEDIKILKLITGPCQNLKKLHIQFSNKIDLFSCKDLIQYLRQQQSKELISFMIKIRTETQVKRMFGYLSKFYNLPGQANQNLNNVILQMLCTNTNLTKVVIDGVKSMDMNMAVDLLNKMPFLMEYSILYDGIDLLRGVDIDQQKRLQSKCAKRKRLFYSLARASKFKFYPKTIINGAIQQFLI